MLLLAPDARPGVNRLQDATALRGQDRRRFTIGMDAHLTVLDTGHRLDRDDPHGWLNAVSNVAARGLHSRALYEYRRKMVLPDEDPVERRVSSANPVAVVGRTTWCRLRC
ncbi:MAG: hypothetical protein M3424_05660 [Actinomycetota bacterium]|nr:hypothetical protein [Actinomycetota bacterium]